MPLTIKQLRSKLRDIRKILAKNIGYLDFKYLHSKTRPELEDLLKKYEKYEKIDTNISTIQNAIRGKLARNKATQLLKSRDIAQNTRDIELRLLEIQRPQSSSSIITDIGSSSIKKRSAISNLYEKNLSPVKPATSKPTNAFFRKRGIDEFKYLPTPVKFNMRPKSADNDIPKKILETIQRPTTASLSRLSNKPRPESASRTFNKFKPLL